MQYGPASNTYNVTFNDYYSDNSNVIDMQEHYITHSECKQSFNVIKETLTISDIFLPLKNNENSRIILIEGAPGMGKTTLCKEIAYQWVKRRLLQDVKLLFLVYLRDLSIFRINDLTDLIRYFYRFGKETLEFSEQCAKILVNRDNSDIAVILDGYDELDRSKDSYIDQLLYGKALPGCRIVVTSRLTASDSLHRIADVRVEVLGFTPESKIEYIKQELQECPDKIQKLTTYFNTHESISSICYMPIMMTILVYVFKEKEELPTDSTELYGKFIALAISYHLQKQNKSKELFISLQCLPGDCKQYLLDLSKFAYFALNYSKKVFDVEDVKKLCQNSTLTTTTNLEELGLINAVQYFNTDKGSRRVFNFLHLSIHEYLAAYYVSSVDQCKQFRELEETFLTELYKETWKHFIALNRNSCIIFRNYSIYCKDTNVEALSNWIVNCKCLSLFESFVGLCNEILNTNLIASDHVQLLLQNDKIEYVPTFQQIYLSFSLNFIQYKSLELYIFEDVYHGKEMDWIEFHCKLLQDKRVSFIKVHHNDLLGVKAKEQQLIKCFELEIPLYDISLSNCYITNRVIDKMILHFKTIQLEHQNFEFNNCTFMQGGFIKLAEVLSSITTIKCLKIHNSIMTNEDANALAEVILSNVNLQTLDLRKNHLEECFPKLVESILQIISLSKVIILSLGNINNQHNVINVHINDSLMIIYLFNKIINFDVLQLLCKVSSLQLQIFDYCNHEVTHEDGEKVTEALLHHESFDLSSNDVLEINFSEEKLEATKAVEHIKSFRLQESNYHAPKEACVLVFKSSEHLAIKQSTCSAVKTYQSPNIILTLTFDNRNFNHASVKLHDMGLGELYLCGNNLGEVILEVAKALHHITSLRLLKNPSNNNLTKELSGEFQGILTALKSLCCISTLKLFDIKNNQITEEAAETLASVITHNTGLKELHLNNSNLGEGMLIITKSLQQISSLRLIDLGNTSISKEASGQLALAIQSNKHLEKLWLCNNNLKSSAIVILRSLSTISTLKLLNIDNTQTTDEASEALASVVTHNTGLKELYVADNNLGEGMLVVTKALQQITSLRSISLDNTNISKEASDEIPLVIKSNKHLEKLGLRNNNLKSSAIAILQSLSTISTLKFLNINNTQTTDEASEALASVVTHNTGLKELYVADNNLGEGMLVVTKALQQITSLRSISLDNTNISKEASDEIPLVIKSNKHLEKLGLSNNNLKSSVIAILQSMSTNSTLKFLNIYNTQITDEASEALASVVMHNTGLEELNVADNNFGEGMLVVTKALQQITSLRSINFGNTNISKEASDEIPLVIKSNKHLEKLGLRNNDLKCSAIAILQSLSTISALKFLNINNTQTTDEASEALASVVTHNTGLEELYVADNNLGEGILVVTKALQQITSLRSISLDNTNISKEASDEIPLVIKSNKHLEMLELSNNNLKCSAIAILQSLSTISTLKFLNINNTQTTDEASEALASVVIHNTGLEELYLRGISPGKRISVVMKALQQVRSLTSIDLCNSNLSSIVNILRALHRNSQLKLLGFCGNTITKDAGNVLAVLLSRNIKLQELSLNLLTEPLLVTKSLQNLSALQTLVFDTCNISGEAEVNLASAITNNKSLTFLSFENVKMSQNIILQSIATVSNLRTLWLGDSSLSEAMSNDLSLAISSNKSLERLILQDNNFQTGLIKIAKACNKLSNIKVLQLAHNCIVPSKVVELTSVITQNASLERLLLGGITLNAAECFHLSINEVLCKTDITSDTNCVTSFNHCTSLEVIYLEMLRKQIDNQKKCLDNVPIYTNAKNFSFVQKLQQYFNQSDITQLKTHDAKQKLLQVDAKKMISSLYILEKVKVIDLENSNIDEDASHKLATALHSNNVLEQLCLRGNKLNTVGALYILNSLEYLTTLQVLDLSYNNISSQSADGIAAVIDSNPLLNQLWLDGNDLLHSTGTIKICKALRKIRTLSILSLCNNGITDDAADELSAVITQNVLLEDLLLSNNQLHSTGIEVIAESLNKLIKLRKLDLFNNNIGKEGASLLAVVVQNSTSLQDLFLSSNNLETSGALEICNALSHICSLHVLTLSNNNINDKIKSQLIEVLNNNHLYALLIGGNGLECGGLKIAEVIENDNIAMQLLDLSDNNISAQDKENIKVVFSKRANFKFYV